MERISDNPMMQGAQYQRNWHKIMWFHIIKLLSKCIKN